MTESRCGILCEKCSYKETMGCKGCINIQKPFWGESCPVKACCESKNNKHCGLCAEFPCRLLNKFSYDENQGDDGLRIKQCENWSKENEECLHH